MFTVIVTAAMRVAYNLPDAASSKGAPQAVFDLVDGTDRFHSTCTRPPLIDLKGILMEGRPLGRFNRPWG